MKKAVKLKWTDKSNRILEQATTLNRYNRWLIGNFSQYLHGTILEIGAGLGGLSELLPQKSLVLSDNNPKYIEFLKKNIGVKTLLLNIETESPKKYHNHFDAILSSNVFEHIKDDQKAFDNCFKLLRKGGHLLLFVPAGPEIFGSLDEALGHYRRYTKSDLAKKAEKAGFGIIKLRHVNLIGFFLWFVRGWLVRANNSSDRLFAWLFDLLITPLLYLERYIPVPFGQSLILIAQKT